MIVGFLGFVKSFLKPEATGQNRHFSANFLQINMYL